MFGNMFRRESVSAGGGNGGSTPEGGNQEKALEGGVSCPYCGNVIKEGEVEFHKSKSCLNIKINNKKDIVIKENILNILKEDKLNKPNDIP